MSSIEKAQAADTIGSAITKTLQSGESATAKGVYTMQCFDKDGNLKWEAKCPNLVVDVGLQDMNNKYFLGSAYTATWYIGLYGSGASNSPAAGNTRSVVSGDTLNVTYTLSLAG